VLTRSRPRHPSTRALFAAPQQPAVRVPLASFSDWVRAPASPFAPSVAISIVPLAPYHLTASPRLPHISTLASPYSAFTNATPPCRTIHATRQPLARLLLRPDPVTPTRLQCTAASCGGLRPLGQVCRISLCRRGLRLLCWRRVRLHITTQASECISVCHRSSGLNSCRLCQ